MRRIAQNPEKSASGSQFLIFNSQFLIDNGGLSYKKLQYTKEKSISQHFSTLCPTIHNFAGLINYEFRENIVRIHYLCTVFMSLTCEVIMSSAPVLRIIVAVLLSLSFIGGRTSSVRAQTFTRYNPMHWSIRACASSPNFNEVYVGDSGFVLHSAGGITNPHFVGADRFSVPFMFHAVSYPDSLHLVIAGDTGLVLYSVNNGNKWYITSIGRKVAIRCLTSDSAGGMFAVGDSGSIFKSKDFGASWTPVASPVTKQLNAITFASGGKYAVIVGNDSTILDSKDAGATWSILPMPYNLSSLGSELKRVDFSCLTMNAAGDSVWVGLEQPVLPLLLVNGNADPAQKITVFPHSGPLTSLVYTGDSDGYILGYAADDWRYEIDWLPSTQVCYSWHFQVGGDANGNNDTMIQRFRCATPMYAGSIVKIIGGGDDVALQWDFLYNDGTFNPYPQIMPGHQWEANYICVDVQPSGYGFAASTGGLIYETSDGGQTWAHINKITQAKGYNFSAIATLDQATAVACGKNGLIIRTTNGAKTWDSLSSGTTERLRAIAFADDTTGVIVGDFGFISRTTDAGLSWNTIGSPNTKFLYSIAFTNDTVGIVTGENGTILRTTDAGLHWADVNNVLSGTDVIIGQVQVFSDGTCFARASTQLLRSNDFGQNWQIMQVPVGDTLGMNFYNPQIGIIGQRAVSSELVADTAYLAYTTNGGSTWKQFSIPIWNYNWLVFYWVDEQHVIAYGIDGFVVEIDFSESDVKVTQVSSNAISTVAVYPNPSSGNFRASYVTTATGSVTIDLYSEDGNKVKTLFDGEEVAGEHVHDYSVPNISGAFYLRISHDGIVETRPVVIH